MPGHAIVGADHPVLLDAQHVAERAADIRHEGRPRFGGRHREAGVVVGYETLPQVPVGGGHGLDPGRNSCGNRFCSVPNTRSMRPLTDRTKKLCPSWIGGNNYWSASYSRKTKLLYIPSAPSAGDDQGARMLACGEREQPGMLRG
jgi:hypothetical protein